MSRVSLAASSRKRACTGAAGLVHGIVGRHAVRDMGVLRVLPADFENRIHVRIEIDRAGGMGDDLIDDTIRHGVQARQSDGRNR